MKLNRLKHIKKTYQPNYNRELIHKKNQFKLTNCAILALISQKQLPEINTIKLLTWSRDEISWEAESNAQLSKQWIHLELGNQLA